MGGGGARLSEFLYIESKSRKKKIFVGGNRQRNRPKPICPFNFFEIGSITMNKCTSYGPDKINF